MIRRGFHSLPGPLAIRVVLALVIVAAALVGLHFFYEWLGNLLLDTGGTVG